MPQIDGTTSQRTLAALFEIASVLGSAAPFEGKVDRALSIVAKTVGCERVSLRLLDDTTGQLATVSRMGPLAGATAQLDVVGPGEGLSGRVFVSEQMTLVDDYLGLDYAQPILVVEGIKSAAAIPIRSDGKCIGVISLYSIKPQHFQAESRLLEGIAGSIGLLLHQARECQQVAFERELGRRQNTFIEIATHELRTPLTSLLGFTELLIGGDETEETRTKWVEMIHESARQLHAIVDGIASSARISMGQARQDSVFDCVAAISGVVEMMNASVPSHSVWLRVPKHPVEIVADRDKLTTVMQCLLENAVKYSPPTTQIEVTIEPDSQSGRAVISVLDEGPGIPPALRDFVFEPFYRIDGQTSPIRGAGLGLHLAKSTLETMGGRIWIDDAGQFGTLVRFTLPAVRHSLGTISARNAIGIGGMAVGRRASTPTATATSG